MLLDSFFLRYKADTGQAVKDVNALDAAETKRSRNKKKNETDEDKSTNKRRKGGKEIVDETKKVSKAQEELGKAGKSAFEDMLKGGGKFSALLGRLGPTGLAAAMGVAAIAGAVAIAVDGINDAKAAAQEAVALGDKAYEARLAQGELIRMQNKGRARGLSDEDTATSAKGVYDKGSEIRAAQRQAARDPASGFNNPLIKQGNLFKKAGVDVNAALGTQIDQQDKYLRALVATGEQERALVEGVELFGRSLHDVRSVLGSTQEEANNSALSLSRENNLRRDLQKSSEGLAATEGKLAAARKKNDEQVLSKTVPATEDFSKALIKWEEAISPLKQTWGDFVAILIEGLTYLVDKAADLAGWFTIGEEDRNPADNKKRAVAEAGDKAEADARLQLGRGGATMQAEKDRINAARKKAEEEAAGKFDTDFAASEKTRKAGIADQVNKAADELITTKDGKKTFEGREIDQSQIDAAKAKATAAADKDPKVDLQKETNDILRDMLNETSEAGKVQEAQTALTKKIESNTTPLVNTGLEQAMALWAGGAGKGVGMDSAKFQGEDRASYESRVTQMRRTINPNTVQQASEARNTANAVSQQATSLNKAAGSSAGGGGSKTVTTGDIKVTVQTTAADGQGMGKDIGNGIADQLAYVVGDNTDGRVS
jgi:hypothetical protein